ncbi:ATP-grasp enzyme [Aphanothece hegewaldii CCALA 016]|uniref:ATP-grasp enzyme n=2 Tax=Aphanothece TaxID=1121 RepID=A0A2T1LWM6_9CHRO|nr:ATP-grasp enzyme [Aphanothece hegewaldii CCALA 016]
MDNLFNSSADSSSLSKGWLRSIQGSSLKTLGTLLLLLLMLPFNLALTLTALVWSWVWPFRKRVIASNPKTVMISGGKMTKALQLARSFYMAGHRVILVETHKYWLVGHRYSWAVDRFYTIPDPKQDTEGYLQGLLDIAQKEQVDLYVPVCSPVASYYDALAKELLAQQCDVFHEDAKTVQQLDDKYQFAQAATNLGLTVPKSFKITHPQQVLDFDFSKETHPYIIKSIPYDSVNRLNLTKLPCASRQDTEMFVNSLPISETKPWVMQEFITGQEYCVHSTVKNGELRVYCCCESSAFQVNYEAVDIPEIKQWVTQFVQGMKLTGQMSFDFIRTPTGEVYAIECNPRTHSAITLFYNHPDLAKAYLDPEPFSEPLEPLASARPTYWTYHEFWRLVTHLSSLQEVAYRLGILFKGKDAIFSWNDPLPFLMVHGWQIPLLLLKSLRQGKDWIRIDFNIGKLVQMGGD